MLLHSQLVSFVAMKTENVIVTSVKVEPLNYVVGNSQSYGDNLFGSASKKQRLERLVSGSGIESSCEKSFINDKP